MHVGHGGETDVETEGRGSEVPSVKSAQPAVTLFASHSTGNVMSDSSERTRIDLEWPLAHEQSRLVLDFCADSGVDSFTVSFLGDDEEGNKAHSNFFLALVPFSLGKRPVERMVVRHEQSPIGLTECWTLIADALEVLLQACDVSASSYWMGRYTEDWAFYRKGELFLGVVSHESCAFLRLSGYDHENFEARGIKTKPGRRG